MLCPGRWNGVTITLYRGFIRYMSVEMGRNVMITSVLRRISALFGLVILSAAIAGSAALAANRDDLLQEQIDDLETRIAALEADSGPTVPPTPYLMAIPSRSAEANGDIEGSGDEHQGDTLETGSHMGDLCTSSHGWSPRALEHGGQGQSSFLTLPWAPTRRRQVRLKPGSVPTSSPAKASMAWSTPQCQSVRWRRDRGIAMRLPVAMWLG